MLDVKSPTTDGRTLILSRYTEPDTDHKLLLEQLKLILSPQSHPESLVATNGCNNDITYNVLRSQSKNSE